MIGIRELINLQINQFIILSGERLNRC